MFFKGLELVVNYYDALNDSNKELGSDSSIVLDRTASAATLEHLLYSFCETDR